MTTTTLAYYEKNADRFAADTQSLSFGMVQNRFLKYLSAGARILNFGCGAGRDARYFLSKGFQVDAIDGSAKMCEIARKNTGLPVRQMLFQDLSANVSYDGIWACASILHLPTNALRETFDKMLLALKDGGYLYASFKYGTFEGQRNGRHFTDFTEETFASFLTAIPGIAIVEEWNSSDVRPGREDEKWLNVILQCIKE